MQRLPGVELRQRCRPYTPHHQLRRMRRAYIDTRISVLVLSIMFPLFLLWVLPFARNRA